MKSICSVFVVILFSAFLAERKTTPIIYHIPTQTFDPWEVLNVKYHDTITVDSFQISALITLGEYKEFLNAAKRDSGDAYFATLVPDSGMCSAAAYSEYMNNSAYDKFPVSGVSWVNGMKYCDWRSLKEQKGDSLRFIYRLPFMAEWVAAYRHTTNTKQEMDFNRDYCDWLLEAFDESSYDFRWNRRGNFLGLSYLYPDRTDDYPVLRRKRIIGNSFHLQHPSLGDFLGEYCYSFEGYSYVSFRMVRVKANKLSEWKWNPNFILKKEGKK